MPETDGGAETHDMKRKNWMIDTRGQLSLGV